MSISVVITCCAADVELLGRCLSSVEWQIERGDEIIVVLDGLDGVSITNPDVIILPLQARSGVSAVRNHGWQAAQNAWVKFLDVDDLLAPFALHALRSSASQRPDLAVIAGGQHVFHNGAYQGLRDASMVRESFQMIRSSNPLLVSYTMIARDVLDRLGGFDERIDFEEDWDLWIRIWRLAGPRSFGFITQPVCSYTIDDERRARVEATRSHEVEGMDVREWMARKYGIEPCRT